MEELGILFKRKGWKLFQLCDYIILKGHLDGKNPQNYIKIITKVDMKLLRYEWNDKRGMGYIYFSSDVNAYLKVGKELKMIFKIINSR